MKDGKLPEICAEEVFLAWLSANNRNTPEKIFIHSIDQDKSISHGAMFRLSRQIGHDLAARGLKANDRVALLAGASISGFSAIADFWGGNVMTAKGREAPTVIDMVANITCPVVGFFGNDDGNPSPEDVDRLDAELSKHGIAHSFHRYDGAGHAFQNFLNEANYRESQAEDAWGKVIDFFGEALA